jgi:ribonuclease BN (tRNA processing enzyme)
LEYIVRSRILIAECTFYTPDQAERAKAGKHMHIDEFAALIEKMQNEYIVITHTTQRISLGEIRRILKDALPEEKYKKVVLLMANRKR